MRPPLWSELDKGRGRRPLLPSLLSSFPSSPTWTRKGGRNPTWTRSPSRTPPLGPATSPPPLYTWEGAPQRHTKVSLSRVRCPPPQVTPPVKASYFLGEALRGSHHHHRHRTVVLTELSLDPQLDQEFKGRHRAERVLNTEVSYVRCQDRSDREDVRLHQPRCHNASAFVLRGYVDNTLPSRCYASPRCILRVRRIFLKLPRSPTVASEPGFMRRCYMHE